MNLYDQLLSLQVIEDAYEEWTGYREELTNFVIETAQSRESIAVFGAGRCNDIDLNRLASYFNQVFLIDKDEQAMRAGIDRQKAGTRDNIEIQIADFVGISAQDYREYADLLIAEVRRKGLQTNIEDLARTAREYLCKLENRVGQMPLDLGSKHYETSVVAGVHSQLISMLDWIWSIMLETIGQNEISVRQKIIALNDSYIQRFNSALLEVTTQNLIIGCEVERLGKPGHIQGAVQALDDMGRRERMGEIQRAAAKEIQWPFNLKQNISYNMLISNMKVLK